MQAVSVVAGNHTDQCITGALNRNGDMKAGRCSTVGNGPHILREHMPQLETLGDLLSACGAVNRDRGEGR